MKSENNPSPQIQKETPQSVLSGRNLREGTLNKKNKSRGHWKPAWCMVRIKKSKSIIDSCKHKVNCLECPHSNIKTNKHDFCNIDQTRSEFFCTGWFYKKRKECFGCEHFLNFN